MSDKHQVIVGNIGTVYDGPEKEKAREAFAEYNEQSKTGYGRAAYEAVTWMKNDDPFLEYHPPVLDFEGKPIWETAGDVVES